MSGKLEDQIFHFSNSSFDPEEAARHFFSEHSENEVRKKIKELDNVQNEVETELRKNVRENYGLFMFANDEINRVGEEMSDLRQLLNATKKILDELQAMRLPPDHESGSSRRPSASLPSHNLNRSTEANQTHAPEGESRHDLLDSQASSMPSWVLNTPRDIDCLIVEQQYSKAVNLVMRSLSYIDSVKVVGVGSDNSTTQITDAIQSKSLVLAQTLKDSLGKLSNSDLFGAAEQTKRLKLLITLGHSALAAQGFASGRKDVIRKALRFVEASGDAEAFTAELSRVFFTNLRDACKSFLDLFSKPKSNVKSRSSPNPATNLTLSGNSDVASLSYLVGWLQEQMAVFVTALARQIQVGAAEYSAEVFQLPISALHRHSGIAVSNGGSSQGRNHRFSLSPSNTLKRASSLFPAGAPSQRDSGGHRSSVRRISSVSRVSCVRSNSRVGDLSSPSAPKTIGPLTFTSQCLQVAFREAVVLDQLGLQGASSFSWNMMPQLKAIVNSFADDIIKDLESKVAQESWVKVKCTRAEISLPRQAASKKSASSQSVMSSEKQKRGLSSLFGSVSNAEDEDDLDVVEYSPSDDLNIYTSLSYQWVAALVTYFIAEVYSLLQVVPPDLTSAESSGPVGGMYSRVDLCEVEPEAVACILRILIRFIRGVASFDVQSLDDSQQECFNSTVEEIRTSLLPSAEEAILKGFFSDGGTLIANPPKSVFKQLRSNLETILPKRRA